MHKIFIDSDIIIDLYAKREPHYIHAQKLFTLVDRKEIKGYTSPLIFANCHYILRKLTSTEKTLKNLRNLKSLVKILSIDEKTIELALNSDFKDFEDAIQYYTTINHGIKYLITRNKEDYKKATIFIYTAEEYLKLWEFGFNEFGQN
jgi:predicted nucleic acid-binding protein